LTQAFRHEVLFYGDDDEYLGGTISFLEGAVQAGEPALAAVRSSKIELLEAGLGDHAGGVFFVDMEEVGRNPALIIPFWREFLDRRGGRDRPVRGIGEPIWPGRTGAEVDECQRHEWLLNLAFDGGLEWSLVCPYDSASLPDDVLEEARHSHSGLEPPAGPFAGPLSIPPPGAEEMDFDRGALHDMRRLVARGAKSAGLSEARIEDLVAATSEVAANSILHGGGAGKLSIWTEDGRFLVQAEDHGFIDEPLVGRMRPTITQGGGRGVWLANHLCDLVQIRSDSAGTRVRLQMSVP
jgi:anti-sigma regulatory factor (Ser/Thr protein kinase)